MVSGDWELDCPQLLAVCLLLEARLACAAKWVPVVPPSDPIPHLLWVNRQHQHASECTHQCGTNYSAIEQIFICFQGMCVGHNFDEVKELSYELYGHQIDKPCNSFYLLSVFKWEK